MRISSIRKLFSITLAILMLLSLLGGCRSAGIDATANQPTATLTKTPATGSTTVPTVPTTQATTPPTTIPTTAPEPTVPETCPPVEGDIYWGEFYGKGFTHPNEKYTGVQRIRLFADGTCYYSSPIYSSSWPTVYSTWTFDGEYLYIGNVESGPYCKFLYAGAENPYESKLIYVETENEIHAFCHTPNGEEWIFEGIRRWEDANE